MLNVDIAGVVVSAVSEGPRDKEQGRRAATAKQVVRQCSVK